MLTEIIVKIVFIPISAVILWAFTSITDKDESYRKALLVAAVIIIIKILLSLLLLRANHGYIGNIFVIFFNRSTFHFIFTFLIIKLFYRFDWFSTALIYAIWWVIHIPLSILQQKIVTLIYDFL